MLYYLFLPLFFVVYLMTFIGKPDKVKAVCTDLIDIMPMLLLPCLTLNKTVWIFVIGVTFANVLMRPSVFVGGALYLLVYGFVGILSALAFPFNALKLLIAVAPIALIFALVYSKLKKPWEVVGAAAYALIALIPCLYAFLLTWNIGFLALVIGDLTLIVYIAGIYKKDWYLYVSNCIFYTGVILTPLFLQTLKF